MALQPKVNDFPRIRSALAFYRVFAYITGCFLLLLCVEMILKYSPLGVELELNGPQGFFALTGVNPITHESNVQGINLSTVILIVHGWLYVVYLFADFRLWSLMRWPFSKFLWIALGGVVPFLSFFIEAQTHKQVTSYLADREETAAATSHTSQEEV